MSNAPVVNKQPTTIAELITSQMPAIAMAIGGNSDAERQRRAQRFARIALTAVRSTPKLGSCTMDSFAAALMTCAQLDLEPNTPQQLAHLIPYENRNKGIVECQFQIGYPGLMELAYRTGKVSTFHADVVYKSEVEQGLFRYTKGIQPTIHHEVDILGNAREGEIVAAYAAVTMKDGTNIFRVIDRKDAERAKSSSASMRGKPQYSPWTTSPDAMWMKTAIKRLCMFLPRTEQLSIAVDLDDKADRGESQVAQIDIAGSLNKAIEGAVVLDPDTVACPKTGEQQLMESCDSCPDKTGCPELA